MSTFSIRAYQSKDSASLYDICLKTGKAGQDATHLYKNPQAPGLLYVEPYLRLEPSLAFVLEDSAGVCGYVLGALDTGRFEQKLLEEWLPPLRQLYPDPTGNKESWTLDERIYHLIHHYTPTPQKILNLYPSHLHIDVLPRAQGQGNGTRLMERLFTDLKKQSPSAVHLVMNPNNTKALRFYKKLGFQELSDESFPATKLCLGLVL
jgi:ribosomal protein S18 acetylase RimI-like enzyme